MNAQGVDQPPTIVLLGASNLTRGLSTVVQTLRIQHGGPVRIIAALGHGRSFGAESRVLGRSLPGILDCGLWDALRNCPAPPAQALITDIGNDVMYGVQPRVIVRWLDECIHRLTALTHGGSLKVNITSLPIDSIRRIRHWHYTVVKNVLFPSHAMSYEQAMQRSFELQHRLERLHARHQPRTRLLEHDAAWYGFDPIHLRLAHWPVAWARFLARERAHEHIRAEGSMRRWRRVRTHMPADYAILGRRCSKRQPLVLDDGTSIELY